MASNGAPKTSSKCTPPTKLRTDRPHPARIYNYWLGGKDCYVVDRKAGDEIEKIFPTIKKAAQENRAFMTRAVRWLAQQGIDQYLDIGTGIPKSPNVHQIAQAHIPSARVVYVDTDPLVLAHARALLISDPPGVTACIDADLRDPHTILGAPLLPKTLDLDRPVALLLTAVLHFLDDADNPYRVVSTLLDALPSGSYLVLSHTTGDYAPNVWRQIQQYYRDEVEDNSTQVRTREEIARFFTGLEPVPRKLTIVSRWQPDIRTKLANKEVACYGGVARVP